MTDYQEKICRLNVNRRGGNISPHKPCLLLAVIDMAEAGALSNNEILYRPELIERFNNYFMVVCKEGDWPNAYMPYFHLKSDGFWHLLPVAGREIHLNAMSKAVSHRDITENIRAVRLDQELHQMLQDDKARQALRAELIAHWFGNQAEVLWSVIREHRRDNNAEFQLREALEPGEELPARSTAFRRIVLQAYDYRCAATGWRIFMPDGSSLIEAAHIVPFSETRNDDPRNGMALTPTFHVALDRNLIAPGPDMKWHVSPIFDKRIPDYRDFVDLDGKDVIFYGNDRFRPGQAYLEQRMSMLRKD